MKSRKKMGREEILDAVARSNEDPLVLKGSMNSDYSSGSWGVPNTGITGRFTVGEVRKRRAEIQQEKE